MCKVQSLIYLTCICICMLTTTSSAFPKTGKTENELSKLMPREKVKEKILKTYAAKNELRSKILKKVMKMSRDEIAAQSKIITQKLLDDPLYVSSRRVAVYISTEHEVQTFDIIKDIFESGKICFIPMYDKNNKLSMVRLRSMEDLQSLPKTKMNYTQPAEDDIREDALDTGGLDMMLVPGVAFTTDGRRLGRGKGCYDRYIKELEKHFPKEVCLNIGLAFTEQICDRVPVTPDDQSMFYVIHPKDNTLDFYKL